MLGSIQNSHLRRTPYQWILGLQWNERKRGLCTIYAVPLMRIMIQREWRKELGLPVTLNAADSDSRFLSAFSMAPPFEEFFFSGFQSVQMIEFEKRWSLGFVGSDLDKNWVRYGRKKNWERGFRERMRSCSFQILKSEYIGAGMRCNRLQYLVIDYTLLNCL